MQPGSLFKRILHFPLAKIIIGLAVCIGIALVGKAAAEALVKNVAIGEDYKNIFVGAFVAGLVLISYSLLFRYYEAREIKELKFTGFAKNALIGFFVGIILQSLVIMVIYIGDGYSIVSINPVSFALPGFVIAFTSAIFEEILFRGILFRVLEEKLGSLIALFISAIIFGLLHLANPNSSIYSAVSIALQAGVLLGAAYIYGKSLWLPIFLHFAWNFAEAGIFGAVISGNSIGKSLITSKISGPLLLTGGEFGPENSIQATGFCMVATSIFLYLSKRQNKIVKPFWSRHRNNHLRQKIASNR